MHRYLIAAALLLHAASASAAVHRIQNNRMAAEFDEASGIVSARLTGAEAPFLTDWHLPAGGSKAQVASATDPVFGKGQQIQVALADGGVIHLSLWANAPFLFVTKDFFNNGAETTDLPRAILADFALDLGKPVSDLRTQGTAGLTNPDKNPGSYVFLTLADPATRKGVVTGWLTHDRASGVIFSRLKDGKVRFEARGDYGHLRIPAGKSVRSETFVIGCFDDARLGQEQFADAMAQYYKIKLRPQSAGYCTWYSDQHGGAGDEKSIVELAKFAARELRPFGLGVVQIDDEWQDGGKFNGPARGFDRVKPNGPYRGGMQPVAAAIRDLSLTAGIRFMPFSRNYQDPEYKDRQDWFVKRKDGKPYETSWGGTTLDLTKPEVQAHLKSLVKTIHGWGYDYFKMDGLWTGSATAQSYVNDGYKEDQMGDNQPFHDPAVTNIEMMRNGLKLVRETAGPDVFFSGCNLSQNLRSFSGAVGLVDSMRIGPDNGQGWQDYRREIRGNGSGTIITGPVRGTRLYFLHGRIWWNDPDPEYVRASVPMEHARLITSWVGISSQFHLNSDWIPALPAERLELLKRTIPAHAAVARPVDYFDTEMPSIWLVSDTQAGVRRDVLGLFNWDGAARTIECSAAKAGLAPNKTYHAFDFWSKTPLPSFQGSFKFDMPATACRVIAVRAAQDHPLVVSTSRHVTQGIIDLRDEHWNPATKTLSGCSQVVANDPYEIRIAGLTDGGKTWQPKSINLAGEDQAAGVTAGLGDSKDILRATLRSAQSRPVRWSLKFE